VRKLKLAVSLAFLALLGGCSQWKEYTWDPTNLTVLAGFLAFGFIFFFFIFGFGRPEQNARKKEEVKQERAWNIELAELRSEFVQAQQEVLDRAMEMLSEKQKDDAELKKLRLKAHSAMAKVLRLQEEMLKNGVPEERMVSWQEV
jgi:hypothetical protein